MQQTIKFKSKAAIQKYDILEQPPLKKTPAFKIKPLFAGMSHRKTFSRQGAGAGNGLEKAGFLNRRQQDT
jgi:hypothetical protein